MPKSTDLLHDVTLATKNARSGLDAKGRLKRAPDFSAPKISSSRPRSDVGVTFHFAHKTISKRNDISESQRDATSAPSHQAYIERLEAVEISIGQQDDVATKAGLFDALPHNKTAHGVQFPYPGLTLEPGRESFGTNGNSKADRVDFWRTIEANEGRTSRVQSRIIAELPCETTQEERLLIAMKFCREFHQQGLPYWATVHSPTKRNDDRNYHLHIAYFDRPAGRDERGRWDFSVVETRQKKNRTKYETRPHKQKKAEITRDRGWVKHLRKKFAEANNQVLKNGNYEKRLDFRSYQESGIRKEPTEHLGFRSNAAEKFGLETTRGKRNAKREFDWKITSAGQKWDDRIASHDAFLLFSDNLEDETSWAHEKRLKKELIAGRDKAVLSAKYDILSQALIGRIQARAKFLSQEKIRVSSNEKLRGTPDSQQTLSLIDIEAGVIDNRLPEIEHFAQSCQAKSQELLGQSEVIWNGLQDISQVQTSAQDDEIFDNNFYYPVEEMFDETPAQEDDLQNVDIAGGVDNVFDDHSIFDDPQTSHEQGEQITQTATTETPEEARQTPTIPGTLLIPDISRRAELRALNEKLMAMPNREVRMRAIASRDASEFLDAGDEKNQAKRGWVVLRAEAERRGVDLATGKQDLSKATDKERAELHRDETLESILEVREEVIRTMSR